MANNNKTTVTDEPKQNNDHSNNGNHNGPQNDNGNHYGHEHHWPTYSDLNYAYEKLGINMDTYIQNAITNGAIVINGTSETDTLIAGSDNTIVNGLEGADVFFSSGNNSILNGGVGNDNLFGSAFDDVINGGDNDDAIFGNDGSDLLNGDAGDDQIYGGSGNDVVNGGAGNDIIYNQGNGDTSTTPGNDLLVGGEGSDSFVFFGYTLGSNNVAKILDFTSGVDKLLMIYFDHVDYSINFEESLVQGADATAHDANDFLIFNSSSGALYYDADGNGATDAVQIATLSGVTSVAASDFAYSF